VDGSGAGGLDGILGWNAVTVGRMIGSRIAAELAAHGLGLVQFGVLSCLDGGTELTSAEIARAVFVRPQSMAQVLDGMERRMLIQRVGVRAKGRRNPVRITADGESALADARAVALASNDLSAFGLSRERSEQLNAMLLAVIRGADETTRQDLPQQ
jgi:DNA-binding MarR family transcriptional regulator